MKKILLIILLLLITFNYVPVKADEFNTTSDCTSLLGSPTNPSDSAYYVDMAFKTIKFVGIVLCILMTTVDYFKALVNNEKELLKGITKKALIRTIYVAVLFFLPGIVNFVLTFLGVYGTCGLS